MLIRGTSPNTLSAIGTSINGALILYFAYMAVRCAKNRDIATHRKWALRLFLVSNAQWFLRVGVFSYLITSSMLGFEPSFGDPFFPFWTFGCYLVPLAIIQLYFYASERGDRRLQSLTGAIVCLSALLILVGIIGLTPFLQTLITGGPYFNMKSKSKTKKPAEAGSLIRIVGLKAN